jgi:hypothetical protein
MVFNRTHRAKAVEYRVSHHRRTLGKRLAALRRSGTTYGTTEKSRL